MNPDPLGSMDDTQPGLARSAFQRTLEASSVTGVPRAGLVLAGLGVALLVATLVIAPPPESAGSVVSQASDGELARDDVRVAARQPQLGDGIATRYDPDADVTYAVFGAGHGYLDVAVPLEGDRRGELGDFHFLLVQTTPGPVTITPLDPGVALQTQGERHASVNQTLSATFDTASPWPGLLGLEIGVATALAGVALTVPGLPRPATVGAALAIAVGVAGGHLLGMSRLLLGLLQIPLGVIGVSGLVAAGLGGAGGRTRAIGLAVALAVAACLATAWLIVPYFPQTPAI